MRNIYFQLSLVVTRDKYHKEKFALMLCHRVTLVVFCLKTRAENLTSPIRLYMGCITAGNPRRNLLVFLLQRSHCGLLMYSGE